MSQTHHLRSIDGTWARPARRATAPTIPREFRCAAGLTFDPLHHRTRAVPTVLLLGDQCTPGQKSVVAHIHATLPQGHLVMLRGQAHAAQVTAPRLVAGALLAQADPS